MNFIKRILSAEYIFLVSNECPKGGSVSSALHFKETNTHVEIISKDHQKFFLKIFICLFLSKKIVINSLYLFNYFDTLIFCTLKQKSLIYLHEGPYAIQTFKKNNRLKHAWFSFLLKNRRIACISLWQQTWLKKEYDLKDNLFLQYNTINLNPEIQFDSRYKYVLMVGYLMHRKGVSFYSQLADYAEHKNKQLKFLWVGGGDPKNLYLSKNVTWLGNKRNVDYYYEKSDVFFLASQDEPFGLVCAEALLKEKKCVVYKETGFYEVIKNLPGCTSFEEYTVSAAYSAIVESLNSSINVGQARTILSQLLDVNNFKRRLDEVFK